MAVPAHRNVSNIRPSTTGGQSVVAGAPPSPHTPLRTISSNFASPSTLRAEEDYVIIELGGRYLRAGFAGDALPKAVIGFGPDEQRRAGDYRKWQTGYEAAWRKRGKNREWGEAYELWKLDLRNLDFGLLGDKIERAMREAFTKYLLIDSRPRRMALVLPSAMPRPLLSAILDTIFTNFQPPTISLLSAPVLTTVGAGLRAGLVVDIGWAETIVTAIYEYREVQCHRTIRASKLLGQEMLKLLGKAASSLLGDLPQNWKDSDSDEYRDVVSFEECEEIIARMAWCKPSKSKITVPNASGILPSVEEEDEMNLSVQEISISDTDTHMVSIPLYSTKRPLTLSLPFSSLAKPCENALFADGIETKELDDEELPLHLLVHQALLRLPVDIRSVCMSRVIITGGASKIPGLKNRVYDEVQAIIRIRDWNPVQGSALERLQQNKMLRSKRSRLVNSGPRPMLEADNGLLRSPGNPALEAQEPDPIEDKIHREAQKGKVPFVQGNLRVVESMGAWSGGSILSQLKISAVSIIEREQWLQLGAAGASRQGEVINITQRQSMGPGGLRTGPGDRSSWTLGPWA